MKAGYKILFTKQVRGFLGGTSGKESTCQCRSHKRYGFDSWVGKIPWNKKWKPTLVFLPDKFHGQRSLHGQWATAHGATKSQTQLSTSTNKL